MRPIESPDLAGKRLIQRPFFSMRRATLQNWGNLVLHTVIGFVTTPIILKSMGTEAFGVWSIIIAVSGYYGLANLGLGAALSRFIARDVELGNIQSLQSTIDAATVFFLITGLAVLLAVFVLGDDLAIWLKITTVSPAVFAQILLISSLGVIADFFSSISNTVLAAAERYDVSSLIQLCQRLSQAIATICVVIVRPGILELSVVMAANTVLFQLLTQNIARRSIVGLRSLPRHVHLKRLGELLRYGSGSILISVANLMRLRLGNILVARYASMLAVTNFTIATNLITNFSSVISSSSSVIGARFTKLDASNSLTKLHTTYRMALFATSFLAFGLGGMMLIFADRFIFAWLGAGHEEAVAVLYVLVPAYILSLAQGPGWNMMFARAKHHAYAWVMLAETIANVSLGVYLAQDYGALGFAWSTAITMVVTKITFQPWYAARIAELPLRRFLAPMMFPALFGMILVVIAHAIGLPTWLRGESFFLFMVIALGTAACFGGLVLFAARGKDYLPQSVENAADRFLPF